MKLKLIFDSTRTLADFWRWQLPQYLLFTLMVVFVFYVTNSQRSLRVRYKAMLWVVVVLYGIRVILGSAVFWIQYRDNYHYVGLYQIVEGTVQNYHLTSISASHIERFQINGINFAYANHGLPQCFHKTAADGGPIREGLQVRIGYARIDRVYDPACIVRLEVP